MVRSARIQFPGAVYHLTARGNDRRDIFFTDEDRRYFLELVGRAVGRFHLQIFAFCLMGNHYHMMLRTPDSNLSSAFHWINTVYAIYFHRRRGSCGHVFQDRYKAILVAEESYWLHLSVYIHLNPVRAGLVDHPGDYLWSSYADYIRRRKRYEWILPDEILAQYGKGDVSQRRNYQEACMGLIGKKPDFIGKAGMLPILGSPEAINTILKRYQNGTGRKEAAILRISSLENFDPESEVKKICMIFGVNRQDLNRKRRDFQARSAAYYHLVENCGMKVSEVASLLNVSTPAVSLGIRRFKNSLKKDKGLKRKIERLSYK
jgi:putative transposase